MSRSQQFWDGYRHASKAAVEWLHTLANEMGDPHAKTVLDMAAFNLGGTLKRASGGETAEAECNATKKGGATWP